MFLEIYLITIALLLTGCKQSEQPISVKEIHEPVSGAFGWKLGDKLPDELLSEVNNLGEIGRSYTFSTNGLFDSVDVFINRSNIIYLITAAGQGHFDDVTVKSLVQSLNDKYGESPIMGANGYESWNFGVGNRQVNLVFTTNNSENKTLNIYYTDFTLEAAARKEIADQIRQKKNQIIQSTITNL